MGGDGPVVITQRLRAGAVSWKSFAAPHAMGAVKRSRAPPIKLQKRIRHPVSFLSAHRLTRSKLTVPCGVQRVVYGMQGGAI